MEFNYNSNCTPQLKQVLNQFQFINESIKKSIQCNLDSNKESIRILDIGCSHGFNSIIELNYIISIIRDEMKCDKLIEIYHSDLENNNFTALFQEVNNNNENSYLKKWANIYCYAIGSSFINQLMPNESCDIIISFFTMHWCENDEKVLKHKDYLIICKNTFKEFDDYIYGRLNKNLNTRFKELRKGGTIVCNLVSGLSEEQLEQVEISFSEIKSIFKEMANDGILSREEAEDMLVPLIFFRRNKVEEILSNLKENGCEIIRNVDVLQDWSEICKSNSNNFDDYVLNFVDSIIGYSAPSMKSSIKGSDQLKSQIFNEFRKRFIEKIYKNPNFNTKFGFIFLILNKK